MQLETEKDGNRFVYSESFWLGKRELSVNGVPLQKTGKRSFSWQDADGVSHVLTLKGSFLSGLSMQFENGSELVLFKNKWYEWLLICLPLVGILFGVLFCGGIGGGLSAFFGFLGAIINAQILRSKKMALPLRIFLSILMAVVFNIIWFGIYCGIVTALAMAYPDLFR